MTGLTGCGVARVDRPWLADCRTCTEQRRSATEAGARVLAEAHLARNAGHDVKVVHRPNPRPRPDRGAGEALLLVVLLVVVAVVVTVFALAGRLDVFTQVENDWQCARTECMP